MEGLVKNVCSPWKIQILHWKPHTHTPPSRQYGAIFITMNYFIWLIFILLQKRTSLLNWFISIWIILKIPRGKSHNSWGGKGHLKGHLHHLHGDDAQIAVPADLPTDGTSTTSPGSLCLFMWYYCPSSECLWVPQSQSFVPPPPLFPCNNCCKLST